MSVKVGKVDLWEWANKVSEVLGAEVGTLDEVIPVARPYAEPLPT